MLQKSLIYFWVIVFVCLNQSPKAIASQHQDKLKINQLATSLPSTSQQAFAAEEIEEIKSLRGLREIEFFKRVENEPKRIIRSTKLFPGRVFIAEYWDRAKQYRFTLLSQDNQKIEKKWYYNARTGTSSGPSGSTSQEELEVIEKGIKLFDHQHTVEIPIGFQEVNALLRKITKRNPMKPKDMLSEVYLLYETKPNISFALTYVDHFEKRQRLADKKPFIALSSFGESMLENYYLEILYNKHLGQFIIDPERLDLICYSFDIYSELKEIKPFYHAGNEGNKVCRAWVITAEEAEVFSRYRPLYPTPVPISETFYEEYTTAVALQGMQFIRWSYENFVGTDEQRKKYFPDVGYDDYSFAIDNLIELFGKRVFAAVVKDLFLSHLRGLDSKKHIAGFNSDTHSDINPLGERDMSIAAHAIDELHSLPRDMTNLGSPVNVKTLFGDVTFWEVMREDCPELFNEFVDFYKSFPRRFIQSNYGKAFVIDPIALMRDHFTDAYDVIFEERKDFQTDTEEAMIPFNEKSLQAITAATKLPFAAA